MIGKIHELMEIRDLSEIVVTIEGSSKSKAEASSMIIEQIELFKNGGPVR